MRRLVSLPPLLLLAMVVSAPAPQPAAPPLAPPATLPAPAAADFAAEAAALRVRDCAGALARLAARAAGGEGTAQLLLGFYAHACEDPGLAERALADAGGGAWEDWRLYLLADSARAAGHAAAAGAAFARLLAEHADSRLRPRALVAAAELALAGGDLSQAAALVESGRRELDGELRARLEVLAWEHARTSGDVPAQRVAARRLLVDWPFEAARLQVVEIFRAPSGKLDWGAILAPTELERRARTLLDLGVTAGALDTLDGAAAGARGFDWHLLRARALTADAQGEQALALLARVVTATSAQEATLAWARASAAMEIATVRRRGPVAHAARRAAMREEARRQLWLVAHADGEPELGARALRLLFAELAEEERHEPAMEALHLLRSLDPADATGARFLWERGWREFATRNPSGAVGYWSELQELYPDSRQARAALYWSGRAFAALGDVERANAVYRRVAAAGTTDFYRKQALVRLRAAAPAAASPPAREAWPADPLLERAQVFSELGLDDLAFAELDGWRARADRRAVAALEALVLARRGARRDSLRLLREAFPSLGGPDQATAPAEALALFYPFDYEPAVRSAASAQGLPPELVLAIIHQESGFDAAAVSRSGARGLMQVMPATGRELARRLGLRYSTSRLTEPEYSIRLGTAYFRQVLRMFDDNLELALAGYNGGPYRIKRLWHAHPANEIDAFLEGLTLEESKSYVKRILVLSDGYRQLYPKAG